MSINIIFSALHFEVLTTMSGKQKKTSHQSKRGQKATVMLNHRFPALPVKERERNAIKIIKSPSEKGEQTKAGLSHFSLFFKVCFIVPL